MAQPLAPATIVVDGATCSLVDAITAANTNSLTGGCVAGDTGLDTIDLQTDVTLAAVDNTSSQGPNALPVITEDLNILGNSHTLARGTVAPPMRLLQIAGGTTVDINSLTLTQGLQTAAAAGGAVFNAGTLALTNSTVSNSSVVGTVASPAAIGGGIYSSGLGLTLTDSVVSGNSVSHPQVALGGGIGSTGSALQISGSTLSSNTATQTTSAIGSLPPYLIFGGHGGGVLALAAIVTVTDSIFDGNTTSGTTAEGGGLWAVGEVALTNSTISNNSVTGTSAGPGPFRLGANGGGFFGGAFTITNSTFSGNSAISPVGASTGGAIFSLPFPAYVNAVVNSTISGNSGSGTGGVHHYAPTAPYPALNIVNTVFGTSTAALAYDHCLDAAFLATGGTVSSIFNLGGNQADSTECIASPAVPATLTGLDPVLAANGGPTPTHALMPGSSAIDAAGICGLTTDQRGFLRVDGLCDAGSYEFNGCQDDGFEEDDVCFGSPIALGVPNSRVHCDEDWVWITAAEGETYEIETSNLTGGADTVLEVYASCGPLLASDDNSGTGLASKIIYTALPTDDFLDIRILEKNGDYATGEGYDLTATCVANCNCLAEGGNNLVLQDQSIGSTETFEACVSITVGPDWRVVPPGDVTLRAGSFVTLNDETTFGGVVTIELDPSLQTLTLPTTSAFGTDSEGVGPSRDRIAGPGSP